MTDHNPSAGNAPARPLNKSIQDRQCDAVQLARDLANKLADDLDALELEARRDV